MSGIGASGLDVTACLREIAARLVDASAIAKASVTCAESGSEREALQISMDLDVLLSEARALHEAVCLVGRIHRRRNEAFD